MLRNITPDTTRARVAAWISRCRLVAAEHGGDGLFGLRDDGERFAVMGFRGVAEDHLAQVGATVVDLGAVALHDRLHDGQDRVQDVGDGLGSRPALLERGGVLGVLHEEEKLALGLGVEEQGPGADVGLLGDLLGRDLVDAMFGEQFAGRGR